MSETMKALSEAADRLIFNAENLLERNEQLTEINMDLLKACKKAMEFFVSERDFDDIKNCLEKAIAKAEGGAR